MIVEALVDLVLGIVDFVLTSFPFDTVPYPDGAGIGATIGNWVGPFDSIIPIAEMADITALWVTVVLPAVMAYKIGMWVWARVPVVGS